LQNEKSKNSAQILLKLSPHKPLGIDYVPSFFIIEQLQNSWLGVEEFSEKRDSQKSAAAKKPPNACVRPIAVTSG